MCQSSYIVNFCQAQIYYNLKNLRTERRLFYFI